MLYVSDLLLQTNTPLAFVSALHYNKMLFTDTTAQSSFNEEVVLSIKYFVIHLDL